MSGNQKKAIDIDGLPKGQLEKLAAAEGSVSARGIAGDPLLEPVPEYISTQSETVYSGKNNTWIVLGRDRPGNRLTGYGAKGDTQCGSIDIVVGRGAPKPLAVDKNGDKLFVDPDFRRDAARIYVSQKSDIDDYFKLAAGKVGNSLTRSAIALKADGIRFIAREGIKLITRTDAKNSQGGDVKSIVGIDLIAGNNDEELQPMVKGDNVMECLIHLTNHVDKLNGIVDSLLMAQMKLNESVTHHFHMSPFFGLPTTTSAPVVSSGIKCMMDHLSETKRSLVAHKINLVSFKQTYLSQSGGKFINSRYNNVN